MTQLGTHPIRFPYPLLDLTDSIRFLDVRVKDPISGEKGFRLLFILAVRLPFDVRARVRKVCVCIKLNETAVEILDRYGMRNSTMGFESEKNLVLRMPRESGQGFVITHT